MRPKITNLQAENGTRRAPPLITLGYRLIRHAPEKTEAFKLDYQPLTLGRWLQPAGGYVFF